VSGQQFLRTVRTVATAAGDAEATVQPPGQVDYVITLSNVSTATNVKQPSGVALKNGFQVDVTDGASSDSSDTRVLLRPGDEYTFRWTGCDSGTACTLTVSGVQYPAGTAPLE